MAVNIVGRALTLVGARGGLVFVEDGGWRNEPQVLCERVG